MKYRKKNKVIVCLSKVTIFGKPYYNRVWLKIMKEQNIPQGSLIENYLPADYCDSFSRNVVSEKSVTSDEFFDMAFNKTPGWINGLMKLRNAIVKPLGLEVDMRFEDTICEKNKHEVVFGMPDKHLTFHASLWCGEKDVNGQTLTITTVVKYNNSLGRLYFFFIRPFHKIIICSMLKRVAGLLK